MGAGRTARPHAIVREGEVAVHQLRTHEESAVRCSFCARQMDAGSRDAERLYRTGDGISGLLIVCAECVRSYLRTDK